MEEKTSIKNKWIALLTALISVGLLFGIGIAVSSATIEVHDIEEGDGIWCTLEVDTAGLVSVHAWTNGSYDDIWLYLYNQTEKLVASDYGGNSKASIDYIASTIGTYKVKVYLEDAVYARTLSVSSNRALSLMPKYKKSVLGVEEGEAIWHDLSVDTQGLVFINAWTNGSYDDIWLYLYNQTGEIVASEFDGNGKISIDYIASTIGTYKVKVYLEDAVYGGTRTISVSSNKALKSGVPAMVSIITDKNKYSTGDLMKVTINIVNPTEDSVTFQWFWVVPQFSVCVPVMSSSIPAGYDDTHDFSFTIPNWGSTPFGNVFYVQLLDAGGEVLDADATCWAYSPGGKAMPSAEVNIGEKIKKTIERIELPS